MKKTFLSVLLVMCLLCVNAFAAEFSFGEAVIENDNISVDLFLNAMPSDIQDISAITIKYEFDDSKLEYVNTEGYQDGTARYSAGSIMWYDANPGSDGTNMITSEELTLLNNKLFTLKFKKLSGASGNADINVTFVKLVDYNFTTSAEATAQNGTVYLGEASTDEDTNPDGGSDNNNPDSGDDDEGDTGTDGETGSGDDTTGGDNTDDDGTTGGDSGNEESGDSGSNDGSAGNDSGTTGSNDDGSNKGSSNRRPSNSGSSSGGSVVVTPPVVTPVFSGFADLAEDNWAYAYAYSLMNKGIISGDGSAKPAVRPSDNITREEAAKIALLAIGIEPEEGLELAFTDSADVSQWAKSYIATAVKHGVLSGYEDNTVRSKNYITREEMVTILARAMKWQTSDAELTFADSADVAQWSRPNIAYAVANGVMNGYEDNTIKPKATITRAETFALVDRCMK